MQHGKGLFQDCEKHVRIELLQTPIQNPSRDVSMPIICYLGIVLIYTHDLTALNSTQYEVNYNSQNTLF